jgi:hypothetical protein
MPGGSHRYDSPNGGFNVADGPGGFYGLANRRAVALPNLRARPVLGFVCRQIRPADAADPFAGRYVCQVEPPPYLPWRWVLLYPIAWAFCRWFRAPRRLLCESREH